MPRLVTATTARGAVVATDSAFLSVGFSMEDEPAVNQWQIDRG